MAIYVKLYGGKEQIVCLEPTIIDMYAIRVEFCFLCTSLGDVREVYN